MSALCQKQTFGGAVDKSVGGLPTFHNAWEVMYPIQSCPVKRDVPRSPFRKKGSDGAVGRHRPHYRHSFIAGTISQAAHLHTALVRGRI